MLINDFNPANDTLQLAWVIANAYVQRRYSRYAILQSHLLRPHHVRHEFLRVIGVAEAEPLETPIRMRLKTNKVRMRRRWMVYCAPMVAASAIRTDHYCQRPRVYF